MDSILSFGCAETVRSVELLGLALMRSESESLFFLASGLGVSWYDGAGTFILSGKAAATDASNTRLVSGLLLTEFPRMVFAGELTCGAGAPCLGIDACDDGLDAASCLLGKEGAPCVPEVPCDDGAGGASLFGKGDEPCLRVSPWDEGDETVLLGVDGDPCRGGCNCDDGAGGAFILGNGA